jgi:hypothetical protein
MNGYYIMINGEVEHTDDVNQWSESFNNDRKVRHDVLDDISISTVFLGIDHSHGGSVPILFETMVFGGEFDQYQERYSTIEEAIEGHQKIFDKIDKGRTKRDNKLNELGI